MIFLGRRFAPGPAARAGLLLLLSAGMLSAAASSAWSAPDAPAPESSPFLDVNNSVSFSFVQSHLDYIEPGSTNGGTYLDYEKGDLNGGRVAFSLMRRLDVDNVYFHAEWTGTEAKVNYTGYYLGGPPYVQALGQSRATAQEYGFKLGKGFALGRSWMITPYLSLGKRYWVRVLGLGTAGSYVESYSAPYYAAGSLFQCSPLKGLVLTGDATIGRTDRPWINVALAGTGLSHASLGAAVVKKAGFEADYRVWDFVHVFAGADYTLFNFGQSAVQPTGYYEPFSRTEIFNYTAGVRLSFSAWHPMKAYD